MCSETPVMATASTFEATIERPPRVHDDEALYEIIDSQKVELPPLGWYATLITSCLHGILYQFVCARRSGFAVMDMMFHLPLPVDRNRRPDVAFVSVDRCPGGRPVVNDENAWDVVPNLAVEVISPN